MSITFDLVFAGTICLSKAGLAEGTNAATFKTSNAVNFAIDGFVYSKAATDNIAFSSGHANLASGKEVLVLVQLNSSGTFSTVRGKEVSSADLAAGAVGLSFPVPSSGNCPIGAIRVKNASGSDFVFGTTDLGASGITATYYDLFAMPAAPLAS